MDKGILLDDLKKALVQLDSALEIYHKLPAFLNALKQLEHALMTECQ